jgi:hypothetical protein
MEFQFHGIPLNSIEFYESEVDGIPWNSLENSMEFHGKFHGIPWKFVN